jgi:hypothetical protein
MRYLIRIAKTRMDEWVNGAGTPQLLAQNIFRLKKLPRKDICEESTYSVDGEVEEVQAAVAHLLTDQQPKVEPRYLVRIRTADIHEAGLQEQDSVLGATGIVRIDFRHRDLVGTKDQFERLVEVILSRVREGQDRVRRLGVVQFRYALQQIIGLPATDRPTHTRDVIHCALTDSPVADLRPDINLAKTELANVTIPEETIALRAFCLEEAGRGTASPDGNWELALSELRDEYAKHYLRELLGQ